MGNWNISIRGVGAHHNNNYPTDADRMARRFVRELKAAGHNVVAAEITFGGAEPLCKDDPNANFFFNPAKLDDKQCDSQGITPVGTTSES